MEEKHKRKITFNCSHLCNLVHHEIAQMLVQADWRQQAQGRTILGGKLYAYVNLE